MKRSTVIVSFAIAAGSAACSEPTISLTLRLPDYDTDLSCVSSVRVYAWGENINDDPPNQCIALDAPVAGFAELQAAIHGKLELDLPASGLAGVDIGGMTFPDCFGDAVFYGGAEFDGGDMVAPLVANFDCSVRTTAVVKPVDYRALLAGVCAGTASRLDRGSIHPTLLSAPLPAMVYDLTEPAALVGTGGTATFADALVSIDPASCMAMGDEVTGSVGCVTPGAPTACATTGQLELTTIDSDFANASMEANAAARYADIVFGTVWDGTAAIKHPIAGARIAMVGDDVDAGSIHYATLPISAPSLQDLPTATATDSTGVFVAYMDHPITVMVTAPGYLSRQVTLAAADFIFGATTIALKPQ